MVELLTYVGLGVLCVFGLVLFGYICMLVLAPFFFVADYIMDRWLDFWYWFFKR